MSGYTPYGPWTDAAPPGVDQGFLNGLETFLQSINTAATDPDISANGSGVMTLVSLLANGVQINPVPTVINGTTSGTVTMWQPLTGTFKLVFLSQFQMRNGSGSPQNIAFPAPFTLQGWAICGDSNTFNLLLGGSAISVRSMSAFGSIGSASTFGAAAQGSFGACDTISFLGGQASAHTGPIILLGV